MQTSSNQSWNSSQRVIVIKHGELMAEAEMEEDLQNYLKMNTYLDSADPWFWPKLRFLYSYKSEWMSPSYFARYTLPHRRKISAIGERVFWSTLNKVEKISCFLSLIFTFLLARCNQFLYVASVLKPRLWSFFCDFISFFLCTNEYSILRFIHSLVLIYIS